MITEHLFDKNLLYDRKQKEYLLKILDSGDKTIIVPKANIKMKELEKILMQGLSQDKALRLYCQ